MLKIKDSVDLKELKGFGFIYKNYDDDPYYEYDLNDNRTYLIVDIETREIGIPTSLYGDLPTRYFENLDILYDLIKANMVEKV